MPMSGCPVMSVRPEIKELAEHMERGFREHADENPKQADPFKCGAGCEELILRADDRVQALYRVFSGYDAPISKRELLKKTRDACNYLLMAAKRYEREFKDVIP